jgi:hypothetical protein
MAFKPDLWGFLILDPARAYAFHFAFLALAAVTGVFVVSRQLGASRGLAATAALVVFGGQFFQAWWTTNAAGLALAAWPVAAFLWKGHPVARLPLVTYAVACWLIGLLYPPFILSAGIAYAVLIAAFRPDALRPGRVFPLLVAAAAGGLIAYTHYAEIIPAVSNTVYPGHRVSDGGGLPPIQVIAHILPNFVTVLFEPLPFLAGNACEIAVIGSFLPLAFAVFADHAALARWAKGRRFALILWAAGLVIMALWMAAPIPGRWAPLFNQVRSERMLLGFGLALTLGLAVAASQVPWRVTAKRVAIFCAIVAAAWAASKLLLTQAPVKAAAFDLAVIPLLLALLAASRLRPRLISAQGAVLAAVGLSAATFMLFNPVQPAGPIFKPVKTPATDLLRRYAAANPKGLTTPIGEYGALLNAQGLPAVTHVLVVPQLAYFRAAYPAMDESAFNQVFNRFAHVQLRAIWQPKLRADDAISIPPDPFAIPLSVKVTPKAAPSPLAVTTERLDLVRLANGHLGAVAEGWVPWEGVSPGQTLAVSLDPRVGRIVSASAYRLPKPELIGQGLNPSMFAAGFGLGLEIEPAQPCAVISLASLNIRAQRE